MSFLFDIKIYIVENIIFVALELANKNVIFVEYKIIHRGKHHFCCIRIGEQKGHFYWIYNIQCWEHPFCRIRIGGQKCYFHRVIGMDFNKGKSPNGLYINIKYKIKRNEHCSSRIDNRNFKRLFRKIRPLDFPKTGTVRTALGRAFQIS